RGFWLYQPKSTTKQRPSEPLVLGNSFGGMYNNQVTQLNTYSGTYNGHTHTYIYGTTGTPSATFDVGQTAFGKIQTSEGAIVASKTGNQKALSGYTKTR